MQGPGHGNVACALHRLAIALRAVVLLAALFLWSACFFPAPIEEEAAIPDEPPGFDEANDIRPPIGTVSIDLDDGGIRAFALTRVNDINLEQTLYWRAIVDYGGFVVATVPVSIRPEQRERNPVSHQYSPCTEPDSIFAKEGTDSTIYLVLSDAEFVFQDQFFTPENLNRPFRVEGDRVVVWVSWPLRLEGECPRLPTP
jgi:hypothetical protein